MAYARSVCKGSKKMDFENTKKDWEDFGKRLN